jgi:hypothetical protein
VELKPDWSKGYSRLGAAYHGLQDWEEAIRAYEDGALRSCLLLCLNGCVHAATDEGSPCLLQPKLPHAVHQHPC